MNRLRLVWLVSGLVAAASLSAAWAQSPKAPPVRQPIAPAPAPAAVSVIRVVIDDNPVDFHGATPQKINASILVPLRGLFEKLGATVQFHRETRTIEATSGNTYLILRLGDDNAFVNNSMVPLAQPPVIVNGSALVPLRFVAQVFGAKVTWVPAKQTVVIRTLAARPKVTITGDVVGQVAAVDIVSTPQKISVLSQGETVQIPVATDTLILVQRGSEQAVQSPLSAIQVGDRVRVARQALDGPATAIRVSYSEITGVLKEVISLADGSHVLLLDNAANAQVAAGAPVMQDGKAIAWPDVKPGSRVTVRTEPDHQVGYSLIVQAPAPPVAEVPARTIVIDSFQLDVKGPLKGGQTVSAVLRGSAGGKAEFSIAGVPDAIPMKEDQQGVYSGSFIVPDTLNINGAAVTGRLMVPGGREPVLIQAPQTITVDTKAPVISNLSPGSTSDVSNGRPRISATLDDGDGSGVDTSSARLLVDGQDVTGAAITTQHFITYQSANPLADGEHHVRLVVADMVGNSAEASWKFVVNASNGLVTSLDSNVNAQNSHISVIRPLHLTLHAQTGGHATFSVGSLINAAPMKETSPGVYEGDYTPDRDASAQNVSVVVKFVAANGANLATSLDTPVTVDVAAALRPTITAPKPNDVVAGHCVIAGLAAPNATVLVSVTYKCPSLGDLYKQSGKAASTEVQADDTGHWRTEDLKLTVSGFLAKVSGTIYTATAVVIDATGQQSERDMIRFRQK